MNDQPRMVKVCEMWRRTSAKTGKDYFSGYAGPAQYLLFDGGLKPHPTRPDEQVHVWRLMIQEKDPDRRPQRRDLPTRGQQAHQAVRERADAAAEVIFSEKGDDEYTRELAERFDRRLPDEVRW